MDNPETELLPVTQADRDAAWPLRPICYRDDAVTRHNWNNGVYDKLREIQAFVRHRLSTASAGDVGEAERELIADRRGLLIENAARDLVGNVSEMLERGNRIYVTNRREVERSIEAVAQAINMPEPDRRAQLAAIRQPTPTSAPDAASVEADKLIETLRDEIVTLWHGSDSKQDLRAHLHMNDEDYAMWVVEGVHPTIRHPAPASNDALRGVLEALLETSGARGTYHALKHADAVENAERLLSTTPATPALDTQKLVEALEGAWTWPCPEGEAHCCCCDHGCCDCDRPKSITPDWLNAETCIENVFCSFIEDSLSSEYGPVDTTVNSGDLFVILSLAGAAMQTRAALASIKEDGRG